MCRWLPLTLYFCFVTAASASEWLLCGAFPGIGGLGCNGHQLEARLQPSPGDQTELRLLDHVYPVVWTAATAVDGRLDLDAAFPDHPSFAWPAGCAYAAVYLRCATATKARLEIQPSIGRATVWLDQTTIPASGEIRLGPDWSRLLVKLLHPRVDAPGYGQPWRLGVKLGTLDGQTLQTTVNDPSRDDRELDPGQALSPRLTVTPRPSQPGFTWLPSEPVNVGLKVALDQGGPFDGDLEWRLTDYDGRLVDQGSLTCAPPPGGETTLQLELGPRPVGFYNLWCTLRAAGGVITRLDPLGCAVVAGRVGPAPHRRKLASAFYWIEPGDYVPWLSRVGMTINHGMRATWWTKDAPQAEQFDPAIDELLTQGNQYGVELVGYLDGGWPREVNPKLRDQLTAKQLLIWFWKPLPEWDTHAYEQLVRTYVHNTVARYRDRIHTWKSYNEIDLHHMSPQLYARIAKLIGAELKQADPTARFVGASFTKSPEPFWEPAVADGAAAAHDVLDLHCYPLYPPTFAVPCNLSGWKVHGQAYNQVLTDAGLPPKPVWWGEVGARRSLSPGGATGQPSFFLKMNAVGLADPAVEAVAWCDPMGAHTDDFSLVHRHRAASPSVCAASVVSRYLDGGTAEIVRHDEVQAARYTVGERTTLVAWARGGQQTMTVDYRGPAKLVDLVGRTTPLPAGDGRYELSLDGTPVLLNARSIEMVK